VFSTGAIMARCGAPPPNTLCGRPIIFVSSWIGLPPSLSIVTAAAAYWRSECGTAKDREEIRYSVIGSDIRLYAVLRFTLSFRDVEDVLAERRLRYRQCIVAHDLLRSPKRCGVAPALRSEHRSPARRKAPDRATFAPDSKSSQSPPTLLKRSPDSLGRRAHL
jgi:hypothetical protein